MKEQWKDIKDFPGYQISNKGRVKSYKVVRAGQQRKCDQLSDRSHIMRTESDDGDGYLKVMLRKGGKSYCRKIHRLVAEAFIPNPKGYETVDHISCNKKDNTVGNLRWMTRLDNVSNAYKDGLHENDISNRCQNVVLTEVPVGTQYLFDSVKDAANFLGVHYTTLSHAYKNCELVRGYDVDIRKKDRYVRDSSRNEVMQNRVR